MALLEGSENKHLRIVLLAVVAKQFGTKSFYLSPVCRHRVVFNFNKLKVYQTKLYLKFIVASFIKPINATQDFF